MSFFKGFADELLKLASHENWGLGGEWSAYSGVPENDDTPLMHDRAVPYDVEWKNNRQDYFLSRMMGPDMGRMVVPGKLSPGRYKDTKGKALTNGT